MGNPESEFLLFWGLVEMVAVVAWLAWINNKWEQYLQQIKICKHYGYQMPPIQTNKLPGLIKAAVVLLALVIILAATGALGSLVSYTYLLYVPPTTVIFVGGMFELSNRDKKRKEERYERQRQERK